MINFVNYIYIIMETRPIMQKNIEESIVLTIFELSNKLKCIIDEAYHKVGLTTQQWFILLHLADDSNLPFFKRETHKKDLMASELADSLNVSRANVTNLVNVLLDKGLVRQYEDDEDRRKKRLTLTTKGISLIKKIQPYRYAVSEYLMKGFNKDEKKTFLYFLEQGSNHIINETEKIKSFHKLLVEA